MVKATGWKFGVAWEQEFGTIHEAMRFACDACIANTLCVERVTDGTTVYDRNAIIAYWDEQAWVYDTVNWASGEGV